MKDTYVYWALANKSKQFTSEADSVKDCHYNFVVCFFLSKSLRFCVLVFESKIGKMKSKIGVN